MSASYEARAFGIRSAMPAVRARRLCPDVVFVQPDFESYQAHSNRFREILLAVTPLVEPISLDEAFLDVAGALLLFGEPSAIAEQIRRDVQRELGISCSVGVAPSKLVAKLASRLAKPDGAVVVRAGEVEAFLDPLPARALWGVGEKTMETLSRLGVKTVGDLGRIPPAVLGRLLGEQHARDLSDLARGIDDRPVVPYEAPKSVSHEETFDTDLDADEDLLREILALSQRVGSRLREDGYRCRTVVLKIRLANFTTLTRSRTLPAPTMRPTSTTSPPSCSGPSRGPAGAPGGCRGHGPRPGGRGAARAAARRALGRRGTGRGPDRAPVRPRLGDARRPARSSA